MRGSIMTMALDAAEAGGVERKQTKRAKAKREIEKVRHGDLRNVVSGI